MVYTPKSTIVSVRGRHRTLAEGDWVCQMNRVMSESEMCVVTMPRDLQILLIYYVGFLEFAQSGNSLNEHQFWN